MYAPKTSLQDKFSEAARQLGISGGAVRVLAAVSGGPDSVCLAHLLKEAAIPFAIAHFDHQTRAGESARDAAFVHELAADLGVAFYHTSQPVEQEAQGSGIGFEAYARRVRYAFLQRTAHVAACTVIATGHTADDQAETVLMRLLRGAYPNALAGIPPVRATVEDLQIVRPLLSCTRAEIQAYLEAGPFAAREDASNHDLGFLRNRLRLTLMPMLREAFNPNLNEALRRLAGWMRDEDQVLALLEDEAYSQCVDHNGNVQRAAFAALPPALQRRVLRRYAEQLGVELRLERLDEAVAFMVHAATGRRFDLGQGFTLVSGRSHCVPWDSAQPASAGVTTLDNPGVTEAFGMRFTVMPWEQPPPENPRAYCTPNRQLFDADAITGSLSVRARQPGDRFVPFGMTGARKLSDYYSDRGIPLPQRDQTPLLVADDAIIWVVGHAIAAQAAVQANTRRIIEVKAEPCR